MERRQARLAEINILANEILDQAAIKISHSWPAAESVIIPAVSSARYRNGEYKQSASDAMTVHDVAQALRSEGFVVAIRRLSWWRRFIGHAKWAYEISGWPIEKQNDNKGGPYR